MDDTIPSARLIAHELPQYRVIAQIGRGGMSTVYLAEDLGPLKRKRVALKVLAAGLASDVNFRERFKLEARIVANLEDRHVIPVYDFGEVGELLYLSMHLVEGADLHTLIEREGPLSLGRTRTLVDQLSGALHKAHEQGLVHRDIKPANVLIENVDTDDEHLYLTDFGIAKEIRREERLTATGQLIGSFDYIAPEQIEGDAVDSRTDIYSLGALTYHCLSGEAPFARRSELGKLVAHRSDLPPLLVEVRPELPRYVDDVIRNAMAKNPNDRYRTCIEFREAFREAAASAAPTVPRAMPLTMRQGRPEPTVELGRPRKRPRRSVRSLMIAALSFAILSAVLLTTRAWRLPGLPSPSAQAPPWQALFDRYRGSIVRIEVVSCDHTSSGSGVLVGPREVVTAAHVVDRDKTMGATTRAIGLTIDGEGVGQSRSAKVLGLSAKRDLALLRTRQTIGEPVPLLERAPTAGEVVALFAFPLSGELDDPRGATIHRASDSELALRFNDEVHSSSLDGGPIIDRYGRVVGSLTGRDRAVPARAIKAEVTRWRESPIRTEPLDCGALQQSGNVTVKTRGPVDQSLAATLGAFFTAINHSDFQRAFKLEHSSLRQSETLNEFSRAFEDSYITHVAASMPAADELAATARVTYTRYRPGNTYESCRSWEMIYVMKHFGGSWKIQSRRAVSGAERGSSCFRRL